jgi:hypothetical protein
MVKLFMILFSFYDKMRQISTRNPIIVGLNVTPKGPSPLVGESGWSRESG